ncbi:MAG: hypothetical protein CVU81_00880 [Euryarchaeota archaeon HGW-Euryarchaeota-1]|nr:MAG: hypothetical protein CVU81_00880 [Euryarchaeota archaeon HGW-Euryarchaeota-1]
MPQKKLFEEIYLKTDILVYPSFTDTFGFAITEAMSFGIPVVSVEGHSRNELIDNSKTGFIVNLPENFSFNLNQIENKELLKNLEEKTEELIKHKNLRNNMSKNCLKEIENGKFSIKNRNKKLKRIWGWQ